MSYTQADIDAMDDAIKRGIRSVNLPSGQSVTYPTLDELIQARNLAVQELSKANAAAAGHSRRYSLARFT